jgi:predicted nucleic acid-binding protein
MAVIRATLDTNVIVSALLAYDRPDAVLGRVFAAIEAEDCAVVLTDYIVRETRTTLAKPYFVNRLGRALADALLQVVLEVAEVVPERIVVRGVAPHAKDDPVIAAALSGGASFLVTGERGLRAVGLHGGVVFLSPQEFVALLPRR